MATMTLHADDLLRDLGDPATWRPPVEFRDSLALSALNSAYSTRGRSTAARRVLDRYRALRPSAATDSSSDLITAMDNAGGPARFAAEVLGNESKLPGTSRFRTEGIHEALTRLAELESAVTDTSALRQRWQEGPVRSAWVGVLGLGPLSWSYLLMNAGVDEMVKPDVKVTRYLTRKLGRSDALNEREARALLFEAAAELNVTPRALDRAIWDFETPHDR
ncbi:hypothetical protein ACSDQ9_01810 [Aestuariimicrobium soli]|uniref:hypothetical protein n=1 Tax=Aestuariimicrobium soli TaxID=2035834 RepID=UPI003EBD830F